MTDENKILVVEDDRDFCESLKLLLEIKDLSVVSANSGEEALDLFDQNNYCCVLMDIKLPGMTGIETLDEIMRRSPRTRVIMMTGCERGSEEVLSATRAGAFNILYKPFRIGDLLELVEKPV